jgi:hypothetical protein
MTEVSVESSAGDPRRRRNPEKPHSIIGARWMVRRREGRLRRARDGRTVEKSSRTGDRGLIKAC